MFFKREKQANGRDRYMCPSCDGTTLIVEYGPLKRPKKGKHEKGLFGTCANPDCKEKEKAHHLQYGHRN
jgi:hypothetical protein